MKINSLYYTHKPGGFCKRLYRLLNSLAAHGHEVTYMSLDIPPNSLASNIAFYKIPFPLKSRSGFLFWAVFIIWATLFCFWLSFRQGQASRWVVFSPYYASIIAPSRLLLGNPMACFIRSKLSIASESFPTALIELVANKICFKISDKIIVQTKANFELAKKLGCNHCKLTILSNNIDELNFNSKTLGENSPIKILTTGVFTKNKNLGFLISTWDILEQLSQDNKLPCPKLKIIGVIRDTSIVETHCLNIEILPWAENLSNEYLNQQIYLHPSLHEGMPNSVLEAMGRGMITLVADTEELKELVANQELTFSVTNPEALAIRLMALQVDQNKFQELRSLCQQRAKKLCFDWDKEASHLAIN